MKKQNLQNSLMWKKEQKSFSRQNCAYKLLELLILLGLLFVTGFFVKDVWNKYLTKATSVKTHFEVQDFMELPVIVMCFYPPIKQVVLEKYNIELYRNIFKSNLTFFEEGSFKLQRDFNVSSKLESDKSYHLENVEVEELYTHYHGLCYRFVANFKMDVMDKFVVILKISKELKNTTKMGFYFTSDQNSYNVIDDRVQGNVLHLQTKSTGLHTVLLHRNTYKKLKSTTNCDGENTIPMKCASQG